MDRDYSALDRLLMRAQGVLAQAVPPGPTAPAPLPAAAISAPEDPLDETARNHAAGLMRVNHAGEVAAQALYRGQALTARGTTTRTHLLAAADEEQAHLSWCRQRLDELGDRPSRLDPLWYAGSFAIGALAGLAGDRWSLGFVEETERQVSEHLSGHMDTLPAGDTRSRAIVAAMRADEEIHGRAAAELGALRLPEFVREAMRSMARVMTRTAYWF
ncbi:MAG TPA: 2-polyprenyl-3-methyl-6-methoxy-1,4-benzoquinone monooxygenase [Candidatus Binatia bacterium]|nr:2-polyprenyl-3-methyl-6-methoxy-1,4-benzoquinone monooxygenase [Candidatus Binatia bacterium]